MTIQVTTRNCKVYMHIYTSFDAKLQPPNTCDLGLMKRDLKPCEYNDIKLIQPCAAVKNDQSSFFTFKFINIHRLYTKREDSDQTARMCRLI